ncbi:hypothetical protein [Lacinutrix sp. MedPE-SW]|uniref:hypothetical protein n=1 Tax=Lacinutrix sp. MedPE-SW TaxID=1860087 RepID=UPI000912776F|nr:hypothetical protein [Lacinutrix sp. MedPE-SW]OIQ21171.1 MAG: hypothetical protein BM549_09355 [Lacinutrix sp. MedPE-SW]
MNFRKLLNSKDFIGVIAVVIFTIIAYFYFNDVDKKLLKNGRYKIGTIIETYAMKGGMACRYKYYVDGKEYIQSNYLNGSKLKTDKYFVIYLPTDPNKSKIFLDIPVTDTLADLNESWSKIPIEFDQKDFDKEFQ